MTDTPEEEVAPTTFDLTIDEFGQGRSTKDSRVELLSAFCAEERAAGRIKDSADNYETRYEAFASRPVN